MSSYKLTVTYTNGQTKTYERECSKQEILQFLFTLGDHVSSYTLEHSE